MPYSFTPVVKAEKILHFQSLSVNDRRAAFLEDTKDFYTSETRAYNSEEGICVYTPMGNSPGCAIGRYADIKLNCSLDVGVSHESVFGQLPTWMHEMGKEFLKDVQMLHDTESYWNDKGLTEVGELVYARMNTFVEGISTLDNSVK